MTFVAAVTTEPLTVTQPTASRTESTTTWSRAATLHLLQLVKASYSRLTDKITKNRQVWTDVAADIQQHLPGVSDSQCDQKWRNLKQHVKKYLDNQKKTGRGRMNRPDFHDEVLDIIGSSHTIRPLRTYEAGSTASSTDVAAVSDLDTAPTQTTAEPTPSTSAAPSEPSTSAERPRKRIRPNTSRELSLIHI